VAIVAGIHPVLEALKANRPFDRVLIARGAGGAKIQEIIELCRASGVPLRFEPRAALDRLAASAAHQGVVAVGGEYRYHSLNELPADAQLVVVLDGIEDPRNLGAILRTAHAAGAAAAILPERRSAGVTEATAKAAAGALEHLPVVRVGNLNRALDQLKEKGFWVYGLDERAASLYHETEYNLPAAIVLGSEGKGLHQQVRERCDVLVRIPMEGKIPSLNVSVAAGIVLFELRRRRGGVR
jgi:23S rRNA (guanosine2251-2'-O)-methyltransferase